MVWLGQYGSEKAINHKRGKRMRREVSWHEITNLRDSPGGIELAERPTPVSSKYKEVEARQNNSMGESRTSTTPIACATR